MRKLIPVVIGVSLLTAPLWALAEDLVVTDPAQAITPHLNNLPPPPRPVATSSATLPPLPKVGPLIKNVASSTRAILKNTASTTRDVVGQKVEQIRAIVGEHKDDVRAFVEQKRKEATDHAASVKEKAREKFSTNVQQHVDTIADRLTSTATNLVSIADRIDARITEAQATGATMGTSTLLLTAARADIVTAQEKITAVTIALETALSSSTPKTSMESVRKALKTAEEAIKVAKDSLREALKSVKAESPITNTN